jgi:hypothetical protein
VQNVNELQFELVKLWREISSEKAAALVIAYEKLRQARIELKDRNHEQ